MADERKKQILKEFFKEQKSNPAKTAIFNAVESGSNLKTSGFLKDQLTETSTILWSAINSMVEKVTSLEDKLQEQKSENLSLKGALETKAENLNVAQKSLTCGICAGFLNSLEIGECQKCDKRHSEDDACSGKVVEFRSKKCRKCGKVSSEAEILIELENENNPDYRVKAMEGFKDRYRGRRIENKKSVNCPFLIRNNNCKKGNECDFNHKFDPEEAKAELKNKENSQETPRFKSNVECRYFKSSGYCKYGERCNYTHDYRRKFNSDWTRYHPNQNMHPQIPHQPIFYPNPSFQPQIPHQQVPMNVQHLQRKNHFLEMEVKKLRKEQKERQSQPAPQNQD